MQDDREKIFGSIRSGLRKSQQTSAERDNKSPLKSRLPADFGVRFDKFNSELITLSGEACVIESLADISKFLTEHIPGDAPVFLYDELSRKYASVVYDIKKSRPFKMSEDFASGYDKRDIALFDSAVLPCAACIAETGTVVLRNKMRLPAALATRLFVIAEPPQLLASLDELFTNQYRDAGGSNLFLITGPSRTADIEKVLVTGVHGPKEVYVIFYQD